LGTRILDLARGGVLDELRGDARDWRRRFGDWEPVSLILPEVASLMSFAVMPTAERPGLSSMMRAAAPATCGHAMEVPLMEAVLLSSLWPTDVICEPGAKMSTHAPMLLNEDLLSHSVVEPTVMAASTPDSAYAHASGLLSRPSFPAATTTTTPF